MKKLTFYSLVIMALLFSACEKPKLDLGSGGGYTWGGFGGPYLGSVNFYSGALAIVQLPANKYFIYRDPTTGGTDSVIVTQSLVEPKLQAATTNTNGWFYDTYTLILEKVTATGNQPWYKGMASCDDIGAPTNTYTDSSFSLFNEETGLPAFWYPLSSTGVKQYHLLPSLTVEGTTYLQVHEFSMTNGRQPSDINYNATTFCWVKGTGIIKRETRYFNYAKTSLLVRFGDR